jgi:transcriptional regulator with XRE-family HTH domain
MGKRYAGWVRNGFGGWLAYELFKRRWPVREITRRTGITPHLLHLWLTGKVDITDRSIVRVAEALGIPAEEALCNARAYREEVVHE